MTSKTIAPAIEIIMAVFRGFQGSKSFRKLENKGKEQGIHSSASPI